MGMSRFLPRVDPEAFSGVGPDDADGSLCHHDAMHAEVDRGTPSWAVVPDRATTIGDPGRVVVGVASAVSSVLGVEPLLVRLAFVVLAVAGGLGHPRVRRAVGGLHVRVATAGRRRVAGAAEPRARSRLRDRRVRSGARGAPHRRRLQRRRGVAADHRRRRRRRGGPPAGRRGRQRRRARRRRGASLGAHRPRGGRGGADPRRHATRSAGPT